MISRPPAARGPKDGRVLAKNQAGRSYPREINLGLRSWPISACSSAIRRRYWEEQDLNAAVEVDSH